MSSVIHHRSASNALMMRFINTLKFGKTGGVICFNEVALSQIICADMFRNNRALSRHFFPDTQLRVDVCTLDILEKMTKNQMKGGGERMLTERVERAKKACVVFASSVCQFILERDMTGVIIVAQNRAATSYMFTIFLNDDDVKKIRKVGKKHTVEEMGLRRSNRLQQKKAICYVE